MGKLTTFGAHIFACILFTIQLNSSVMAFERTSNVDEFTIKNHRTRMRQNYILHNAMSNEATDNTDDSRVPNESGSIEADAIPEELPSLIVDYANMIRNDIILMDNSVQTRTRKRGSIKTENYQQLDVPCSCEEDGKKLKFLGEDYVPRTLETRYCNERLCPYPFGCSKRMHNVTVLRRKKFLEELSQEDLPDELKRRWVALKEPVVVGCTCSRGYIHA